MKPVSTLLAIALALPAAAGAQTIFKWVDANGVTNYTTSPPPSTVKVAALNASPTTNLVASAPSAGVDEALYWRERRQRELAEDISRDRARRDDDLQRQQLASQAAAADEQAVKNDTARLQAAYSQCINDHRTDCVYGMDNSGGYGGGAVVVVNNPNNGHGHDGDHHHHPEPPKTPKPVLMNKLPAAKS